MAELATTGSLADLASTFVTGGPGADTFVFGSSSDIGNSTTASSRERITDFVSTKANPLVHDYIDLSAIDANTGLFAFGNQAFTLLAKGAAISVSDNSPGPMTRLATRRSFLEIPAAPPLQNSASPSWAISNSARLTSSCNWAGTG